jgi:HD-GYP domain-containing protein (c-di-GMP phosphodiesterase class II)
MCDPTDVATAGLLHDIGLADVPSEIVAKLESQRTKEEQEIYKKHPEFTINILKKKKLILSEPITKAILQHHECFNGSGYPNQLAGNRICKEAQIVALADRFDELTTVSEGKPLMSPREAVDYLRKQALQDPTNQVFDPDLLKAVCKLFPADK